MSEELKTESIVDNLKMNNDELLKMKPEYLKECTNTEMFLHSLYHMKLLYNKCVEVVDCNVAIINSLYDMSKTITQLTNPENIEYVVPIIEKLNSSIKLVLENHSYTYITMSKIFVDYLKIKPKEVKNLTDEFDSLFKIGEKTTSF